MVVILLPLVAACSTAAPPALPEPPLVYVEVPAAAPVTDVDWSGRHDLLVLPASGDPIPMQRAWRPELRGADLPLRRQPTNIPAVAIDARRSWIDTCQHLAPWASRGAYALEPPPHLRPRKQAETAPTPIQTDCAPLAVARGPARPAVPDMPEWPTRVRAFSQLCTGDGPDEVAVHVDSAGDRLQVNGGSFDLDEGLRVLRFHLRELHDKGVRIGPLPDEMPWELVQLLLDGIAAAGSDAAWLPACPG